MSKMKYVLNKHTAPITAKARDEKGKVMFVKVFQPERTDVITGRQVSTGYLSLTEDEYDKLCETSKTFKHYKDVLKLLVAQDDLPSHAKTPHEALADAWTENRRLVAELTAVNASIEKLKAELFDVTEKYHTLESASTDEEKLKPLNDAVASLTAKNGKLAGFVEDLLKKLGELATDKKVNSDAVRQFVDSFNEVYKTLLGEKKDFE